MDKIIFKWSIPESKKDITIDTWTNWVKYTSSEEDIDADFLQRKMYEMFCGVPMEHYNQLKQSEINEIEYNLGQVFESKSKLIKTFEFKGVKYGLIPNFREDITAGELIDLDKYLLDKDYTRLMSILYRPIKESKGKLYQIEPYFGTHTDFSDLDYEKLDGVLTFFFAFISETRTQYPEIYPKNSAGNTDSRFGCSREDQFVEKWGGYTQIVWLLAQSDVTKLENIYKMKYYDFLYWAAFIVEKSQIEAERYSKK